MSNSVFMVDACGEFPPSKVRIVWYDEPRPPHPALDALVAETWARQTEAARRDRRILFNGQLARYLRHRIEDGALVIDVGPTDYVQFTGTNLFNWDRGEEFGWDQFSNPIGTSATLITSDGWLVHGVRSQRVAFHSGYVHPFGGALEARDRRDDGTVDAFASIRRELDEELGLKPDDVESIICLGLIRDRRIRQPELVFDARIRWSRSEAAERIRPDDPAQEHVAIAGCRDDPDAILPFIRSSKLISPVAIGSLCLHGRRCFGQPWYTSIVDSVIDRPP